MKTTLRTFRISSWNEKSVIFHYYYCYCLLFIIYYYFIEKFFSEPSNPVLMHFQWDFFFQWGADFSEFKTNQLLLNSLSIIQARNFSREDAPFFFFWSNRSAQQMFSSAPPRPVPCPAPRQIPVLQINDSWSINDPKSDEFKSYRIDFNCSSIKPTKMIAIPERGNCFG